MMDIDLGQVITILANVGVIMGIAFLGIELRQNNQYMAANARYNMLQNQVSMLDQISSSSELGELIVRAADSENLSRADELRLLTLAMKSLRNWLWEFEEYQAGRLRLDQLPVVTWRLLFNGQSGMIKLPFDQVWQAGVIPQSNPSFSKFMEENVIDK